MYEELASFAQTWGLLLFVLAFVLVLVYALAPGRKDEFKKASEIPLKDKDKDEKKDGRQQN